MRKRIGVGKQYTFEAAHALLGHPKCGFTHGHTYTLEVMVEGKRQGVWGFVIDFHDLDQEVKKVLSYYDHKDLSTKVMPYPTVEEIASRLFDEIERALEKYEVELVQIVLWEGDGGYAIVTKEGEVRREED